MAKGKWLLRIHNQASTGLAAREETPPKCLKATAQQQSLRTSTWLRPRLGHGGHAALPTAVSVAVPMNGRRGS